MIPDHYHDPMPNPYADFDFACSKRLRSLRHSQEDMLGRRVISICSAVAVAIIAACRLL
jgi:hypothetical protein